MSEGPISPMPDEESGEQERERKKAGRPFPLWASGRRASTLAAGMVLLLATGAVFWPGGPPGAFRGVCLVFDPCGGVSRNTSLYHPLTDFLAQSTEHSLELVIAKDTADFQAQLEKGADFVFCPDGLGLALEPGLFVPLVAGRRTAPRNLRPRCVLVYRLTAGLVQDPWLTRPSKTIFGDSLSLSATGILRTRDRARIGNRFPTRCASGPDSYDHSPALHALRLGCFDYAIVRQWDAERFFAEGLLPLGDWGMEILTSPVPDTILFASRRIPAAQLLDLSGGLARLGRSSGEESDNTVALIRGLRGIHLSGFNLLVEPDLDQVRGSYLESWPPARQ